MVVASKPRLRNRASAASSTRRRVSSDFFGRGVGMANLNTFKNSRQTFVLSSRREDACRLPAPAQPRGADRRSAGAAGGVPAAEPAVSRRGGGVVQPRRRFGARRAARRGARGGAAGD